MLSSVSIPELLAPAGSEESLRAAVENGADAVYFGIAGPDNFNARVRAKNIPREKLRETMAFLHQRGVRGYVTLNTLVFPNELAEIETLLREFVEAEVDAILVQDFGVARLAQRLCPTLPLHASTQMSLTAAEGIALAQELGIERVVLPRELSLEQIAELRRTTTVELEAFVHGALCISFSGQCYASLTLGGRSANRGRCAQPCRMPYTLLDGQTDQPITEPKQLLSPCDLAALPLLPQLIATGVNALKIEGRLKPPEYVAEVTKVYREAIDHFRASSDLV
jgi:putative protease